MAATAATAGDEGPVEPPTAAAEPAAAPGDGANLGASAPPPPATAIDVAVGSMATAEEVSVGRVSNWCCLAVLALAVVLITTRVRRTSGETVSIHEEGAASPPPAPEPPIVRGS